MRRVGIAEIQPECPVAPEDSPDLIKDIGEVGDEEFGRRLRS